MSPGFLGKWVWGATLATWVELSTADTGTEGCSAGGGGWWFAFWDCCWRSWTSFLRHCLRELVIDPPPGCKINIKDVLTTGQIYSCCRDNFVRFINITTVKILKIIKYYKIDITGQSKLHELAIIAIDTKSWNNNRCYGFRFKFIKFYKIPYI